MAVLKVLIISEMSVPYATGGGETRYAMLSAGLARLGHAVTWLSMKQRDSPAEEVIEGVRCLHRGLRIPAPPARPLAAKLAFMASVVWHLLRNRYDVVDCQTYAPLPAARLGCWLSRTPLVATIHDTSAAQGASAERDQWLSGFDRVVASRVESAIYRLGYDRIINPSRSVCVDLTRRWGVKASAISVVQSSVDVQRIDATAAHTEQVDAIFVGRLVPHKHAEIFLAVAVAVNARRQAAGLAPLRLRLVGGGPLAAQVSSDVQRLGLTSTLDLRGELANHDEVISHIKAARVLVLPSTREGFGLVLAEAMATQTAFAAFGLPPVAETVGEELQDCLADVGDVAALADIVDRLTRDEAWRLQHVALGRRRVELLFDVQRLAPQTAEVYRQAMADLAGQLGHVSKR